MTGCLLFLLQDCLEKFSKKLSIIINNQEVHPACKTLILFTVANGNQKIFLSCPKMCLYVYSLFTFSPFPLLFMPFFLYRSSLNPHRSQWEQSSIVLLRSELFLFLLCLNKIEAELEPNVFHLLKNAETIRLVWASVKGVPGSALV